MTKEQHDFINQLAERYGAHMAQLSIRRIGDRDIALDLVQETFLIACCKADTVCTHVKPAAWLYQTLSNLTKQSRKSSSGRYTGTTLSASPAQRIWITPCPTLTESFYCCASGTSCPTGKSHSGAGFPSPPAENSCPEPSSGAARR